MGCKELQIQDFFSIVGTDDEEDYSLDSSHSLARSSFSEGGWLKLPECPFTPDIFNNVAMRRSGDTVEVSGSADKAAAVTINGERLERDGEHEEFFKIIDAGNQDEAVYVLVKVTGVLFDPEATPEVGGDQLDNVQGADLVQEIEGSVYIPKNPESPLYDNVRGHLVEDSTKKCFWDFENRLRGVESRVKGPDGRYTLVSNDHDHLGRRIKKSVHKKSSPTGDWSLTTDHFFYYDGVLLDGSPADFGVLTGEKIVNHPSTGSGQAETRSFQYIWGLDTNGIYQGMGGVGGLIAVVDKTNSKTYIPLVDKQGTIHSYIDADNGAVAARFAYSPYGERIHAEGPMADKLNLGFQSKYHDREFDLINFGLRYLDTKTCRWLSRDPVGEAGGLNLYAAFVNDPVNGVEYLGLTEGGALWGLLPFIDKHGDVTLGRMVKKLICVEN